MDELRVPKRSVRVEIRTVGGESTLVDVHLADLGQGRERLSDLLEGGADFLPATLEGGRTILLRRDAIAVAFVAPDLEVGLLESGTTPTEAKAEVVLVDGFRIEGLVRYVMQAEQSRLLDFLNSGSRFFPVWTEGPVALVARRHVASVTPG